MDEFFPARCKEEDRPALAIKIFVAFVIHELLSRPLETSKRFADLEWLVHRLRSVRSLSLSRHLDSLCTVAAACKSGPQLFIHGLYYLLHLPIGITGPPRETGGASDHNQDAGWRGFRRAYETIPSSQRHWPAFALCHKLGTHTAYDGEPRESFKGFDPRVSRFGGGRLPANYLNLERAALMFMNYTFDAPWKSWFAWLHHVRDVIGSLGCFADDPSFVTLCQRGVDELSAQAFQELAWQGLDYGALKVPRDARKEEPEEEVGVLLALLGGLSLGGGTKGLKLIRGPADIPGNLAISVFVPEPRAGCGILEGETPRCISGHPLEA